MDLTPQQQEVLNVKRNSAFYEHTTQSVDATTGEILHVESETIAKTSSEPDFIKLYYSTMLVFNGVKDIPLSFVCALSEHITFSNSGRDMTFSNTRIVREAICSSTGIKTDMYNKYIKRSRDAGLIIPVEGYRGAYSVNPFFIAKGKWDSIKQLRADFDYTEGKWKRLIVTKESGDESPSAEAVNG